MYNEELKLNFLDNIANESIARNKFRFNSQSKIKQAVENTVSAYSNIFKSSMDIETELDKDIHSFNIDELTRFFHARNPKSKTSARTIGRIVTKYIDWSIDNNISDYSDKSKNPLRISQEYFNQFAPEESTQYLSVFEVQDIIDDLVNDQDAVIIALLFNGVQGKALSELRNLTKNDIFWSEKLLSVMDDKNGRYRDVDLSNDLLDTLKLLKRAYLDPEYIKKNGEMEYNIRVKDVVELPTPKETPYIIKTAKTQGIHFKDRATQYTIMNRLDMIRSLESMEEFSHKLNTKNIVRSGMIFEAKCIIEREGVELDNNVLKRVCDKFNVKNHWAVKDFINMEVIESLYGEVGVK